MNFNPIVVDGRRTLEIAAERWGHILPERRFRAPDGRHQRYLLRTHRATGACILQATKLLSKPRDRKPPAAEMPKAA